MKLLVPTMTCSPRMIPTEGSMNVGSLVAAYGRTGVFGRAAG